jgi:hypothetical protein
MQVAYELRAARVETFVGGSVALEGGKSFDIGKALKDGRGVIVTSDLQVIDRLDQFPALKRTSVPAAKPNPAAKSATRRQKATEPKATTKSTADQSGSGAAGTPSTTEAK